MPARSSKKYRKERANQRTIERNKRTPKQQIAVLDRRLGKGQGAKKERLRLHEQTNQE